MGDAGPGGEVRREAVRATHGAEAGRLGVILAGGRGSRMGGVDKALIRLGPETLLARAERRLGAQVGALVVSANGDPARLGSALEVLADPVPGFPGPLGGVLAGLDRASEAGAAGIVTVAVDTPFFPGDLVARLAAAGVPLAVAATEEAGRLRWHGAFALWPVAARGAVREALARGERRVRAVAEALGAVPVVFPRQGVDPFLNVNTPEDLAEAERMSGEAG
jgi:molybdopterin-guanine dinucleotide biosynthesis protein A